MEESFMKEIAVTYLVCIHTAELSYHVTLQK
jgi:hypothetical protein